jgi:hypothetical protein
MTASFGQKLLCSIGAVALDFGLITPADHFPTSTRCLGLGFVLIGYVFSAGFAAPFMAYFVEDPSSVCECEGATHY